MSDSQRGVLAALGAYVVWGISPVFWKALAHVPPLEVFAHRTLWSFVLFTFVIAAQGRGREFVSLVHNRRAIGWIAGASAMISVNWLIFIYSVQIDRLLEASIGYYIFPLVAVGLGYLFLRERLGPTQSLAILVTVAAVILLTLGLGVAPWISLALAFSFGAYGLIKARLSAGPVLTVAAEVMPIAPFSLVWIFGMHQLGWVGFTGRAGGHFGHDWVTSLLLMASGLMTAVPLILFSYASRRVSYATVGVLQYLNPTIQLGLAALVFAEPVHAAHKVALPLIWLALAIYTFATIRQDRRSRLTASSTS